MSDHITISGVFSDPNGIPIAGAKIVITSQTNTQDTFRKLAVVQTTDEVGRYLFSLLPGGYNVVVLYPNGNQVVLGEFSLQTGSPSGTLNDYLLFGGQILTDPIIYSDIKRIYENILLTAAVVQAESAASLKINHYLAEIAAAGAEAQTIARGNIGAIDGTGLLQTVNRLSEIAAAGAAAQADVRKNIGAIDGTGLLMTGNNLSEIAAAGAEAQASARSNLNAQQSGLALLIANNFSEIAAAGAVAQAAAQSNLGIVSGGSGGGGDSGRFLGSMLIISSGTYDLIEGTETIIPELVGGGGGSGGTPTSGSSGFAFSQNGHIGAWVVAKIPKSQLSTAAANKIIVSIGAAGTHGNPSLAGTPGGNTSIDTNVVVANGGAASPVGIGIGSSFNYSQIANLAVPTVSVRAPSTILSNKNSDGIYERTLTGLYGWLTSGPYSLRSTVCPSLFSDDRYGRGGLGVDVLAVNTPGKAGNDGTQGAVRLWMYS